MYRAGLLLTFSDFMATNWHRKSKCETLKRFLKDTLNESYCLI